MIYDDGIQNDIVFSEDFVNLAKQYLSLFFKNKFDANGNEIPPEILFTKRNISLVLNLDIETAMPLIYEAIEGVEFFSNYKCKVSQDIAIVLKLLSECSKLSIPKSSAAGLVAVYFEVCKGCELEFNI